MNFLVTDGELLAATRRDRTLYFAAESAEGVPIVERPGERHRGARAGDRQRGAPGPGPVGTRCRPTV